MIQFLLEDFVAQAYYRDQYIVVQVREFEIFFSFDASTGGIEYGINKPVIDREALDALANHILMNYLDDIIIGLECGECPQLAGV